jgi:hypothetical protein
MAEVLHKENLKRALERVKRNIIQQAIAQIVQRQWEPHYRELRKRGISVREAWNTSKSAHGPWRLGLPELAPARAKAA